MELNPELANQFRFLGLSQGLLWGPCTREDSLRCSPLADGAHNVVGTFALVEPRVVAVPHQLAGLCLVAPHILVKVTKVHVGELLPAQHSCTGHPPLMPTKPMWGGHSGEAAPSYLPLASGTGGPCAPVPQPGLGSDEVGFCHIRPYGKTQRSSFPQFKP